MQAYVASIKFLTLLCNDVFLNDMNEVWSTTLILMVKNLNINYRIINHFSSVWCKDWHGKANVGEHGIDLDVASTDWVSCFLGDAEACVAIFSPAGAVRGTNDPVSIAGFGLVRSCSDGAVTNNSHEFIHFNLFIGGGGALTVSSRNNTCLVELKAAGGVDCDSKRLDSNESLSNVNVEHQVLAALESSRKSVNRFSLPWSALSLDTLEALIEIVWWSDVSILCEEFPGARGPSTHAPWVLCVTVNQLIDGHPIVGGGSIVLNGECSLESLNWGNGPVGIACELVIDWIQFAWHIPVHWLRDSLVSSEISEGRVDASWFKEGL
jgi:hypothetical protein